MNYEYKKGSGLINELIAIAEFGPRIVTNDHFRYFAFGNDSISIVGFEKFEEYLSKLEVVYALNKEINKTYSLKKFEDKIIDLIRLVKAEERATNPDDVERLFDQLLNQDPIEFEIFRELFGGSLNIPHIQFGDFTIYNVQLSKTDLLEKYPALKEHENLYFDKAISNLLISIKAIAREKEKAHEIADFYFRLFDNVMSYVIADLSHKFAIGIFNFRGHRRRSSLSCSKKSFGVQNKIEDRVEELDLENSHLKDTLLGQDLIWSLITKEGKTPLEKRLLNTVEWIGKAVHEKDLSKALFQFVIAIEGMLQFNEKAFITASIVSQLSEWLAFIIEDDLEKRKSISKYFKEIYQKRSSIAHGGTSVIDIGDLKLALQISKRMTISFLTKEPFKAFETIDQVNDYITELKFK